MYICVCVCVCKEYGRNTWAKFTLYRVLSCSLLYRTTYSVLNDEVKPTRSG